MRPISDVNQVKYRNSSSLSLQTISIEYQSHVIFDKFQNSISTKLFAKTHVHDNFPKKNAQNRSTKFSYRKTTTQRKLVFFPENNFQDL